MKTEVLIATRKDPDLRATVCDITINSGCRVRVHEDAEGRGPQAVRHQLIASSTADVVIVMDGHMRVRKGTLDAAAEYVGNRGHKVACLRCFHSPQISWDGTPYAGATLQWGGFGKDEGEPQAFVAKWRKEQAAGKIGAVMGACYVMRRDWYMDGLRAPWQYGRGWGCDEELISAATWLRGGEVELLPWVVWHRVQSSKTRKYIQEPRETWGVWANRIQLLQMLPMPQMVRNKLMRVLVDGLNREQWLIAANMADERKCKMHEYRSFLASGGLSWQDFEITIIGKETIKVASMMELREQARAAGITVPFGCRKADLQAMLDDRKIDAIQEERREPPAPMPRANWGAHELNGRKGRGCTHCGSGNTATNTTRSAGRMVRRYRACLDCGRPFVTTEVQP